MRINATNPFTFRRQLHALAKARALSVGRCEVFNYYPPDEPPRRYSIDCAMVLIEEYEIPVTEKLVTLEDMREGCKRNTELFGLDPFHVAKADLTKPLIIRAVHDPAAKTMTMYFIDGWHRIAKAVAINHPEPLSAYVIPDEIAELCRV